MVPSLRHFRICTSPRSERIRILNPAQHLPLHFWYKANNIFVEKCRQKSCLRRDTFSITNYLQYIRYSSNYDTICVCTMLYKTETFHLNICTFVCKESHATCDFSKILSYSVKQQIIILAIITEPDPNLNRFRNYL